MNFVDPDLVFRFLRDDATATDFGQNLQNDLTSTGWHFKTDSNIAILIYSCLTAIFLLHFCKFDSDRSTNARDCLLYTSPSPRDRTRSRMPSSA